MSAAYVCIEESSLLALAVHVISFRTPYLLLIRFCFSFHRSMLLASENITVKPFVSSSPPPPPPPSSVPTSSSVVITICLTPVPKIKKESLLFHCTHLNQRCVCFFSRLIGVSFCSCHSCVFHTRQLLLYLRAPQICSGMNAKCCGSERRRTNFNQNIHLPLPPRRA